MVSPSDLSRLPGPEWLRARRATALARAAESARPTAAEEVWRYSRIDELDPERFAPVLAPGGAAPPEHALVAALGEAAATAVVVDGWVIDPALGAVAAERGVVVRSAGDDDADLVGAVVGPAHDAYSLLHDAVVPSPLVVRVPPGVVVEQPIVVVHALATDGMASPHVVIDLGADSEATVVEVAVAGDVAALVVPVTELRVGPAARLRHVAVQEWGSTVWQLGRVSASVGADASLLTASVALGGDYARVRLDVRLDGKGAEADLVAVYFGEGSQMHDYRTLQDHRAPRTRSNLLFKGAVEDKARSVYSGLIKVRPEAPGTSAFQTNRNIKLSPDAWAESVPNLEIETNDVQCSHASAVGPIDEEQLFYLHSRGVPPDVAERLVVLGFFDEVVDRLPVPPLRPWLRDAVRAKLDRRRA